MRRSGRARQVGPESALSIPQNESVDEELTCYFYSDSNHPASDRRLLERYRQYGDYAQRLERAATERCQEWLRAEDGCMYCRL